MSATIAAERIYARSCHAEEARSQNPTESGAESNLPGLWYRVSTDSIHDQASTILLAPLSAHGDSERGGRWEESTISTWKPSAGPSLRHRIHRPFR